MIGPEDFQAALADHGRIASALATEPNFRAWMDLFEALSVDFPTVLRLAECYLTAESGPAFVSGLALGIIAGRRDAAENLAAA